ncbi:lysosome-associated membrane glycoprotein 1a [Salarias fasciatus]|uniref:Lysosome-associated membrane glycoprotein 1 n=1 Tax=Salarias fasciatus TaxID=181472 RepID=A0A672HK99_SALFA|nr:lysosome-associated membrane glycoprotein 1 [Salarias fasciatus]
MRLCHALAMLLASWLAVLGGIHAVSLEVKEGNSTCIKADLSASFSIAYNTSSGSRTAAFSLPDSTAVDASSSSCGADGGSPWLVAVFGSGHAFGLSFSTNGSLYSVANLTLQYNLSDTTVFPNANSSDVVTVVSTSVGISAAINTTYRCASATSVGVDGATVTFTDMRMEAYMPGNDLSPTESVCVADQTSTTPPPTTATSTSSAPTAAPTPPGTPERGSYSVNNSNGTVCLLAQMGLQLNVSYFSQSQNKTVQELVNLTPSLTNSSGSCEASSATLVLTQEQTTNLNFTFTLNSTTNKYHLSAISLFASWSDMAGPFSARNTTLNYMRSTVGRSYMCNAEQTLAVEPAFSLNTFRLQVQPFGVTTDQFATAEECQLDQDQMLIPIIVGAALAGLVLIVLIAYLIGRKRSHAGYQTI